MKKFNQFYLEAAGEGFGKNAARYKEIHKQGKKALKQLQSQNKKESGQEQVANALKAQKTSTMATGTPEKSSPTAGAPQKTGFGAQDKQKSNETKKPVPTGQYMTAPDDGKSDTKRYERGRHHDNYRANRGKTWRKETQKKFGQVNNLVKDMSGRTVKGKGGAAGGSGGESDVQFKSSN